MSTRIGQATIGAELLANGADPRATDAEGSPLTFSIASNGGKGVARITNPTTGAFTYTA